MFKSSSIFTSHSLIIFFCLVIACHPAALSQSITIQTFTYTGATQTFVVPPCVGMITVQANGAPGGAVSVGGGEGGRTRGVLTTTPGQLIYIHVGGQGSVTAGGFNGGGSGGVGVLSSGAGGGGASDIRVGGNALIHRVMVAAGGGGAGSGPSNNPYGGMGGGAFGTLCINPYGFGGEGGAGAATGGMGSCSPGLANQYGTGGSGAGMTAGGLSSGNGNGSNGSPGSIGLGGTGGGSLVALGIYGAGGGGGGYYGGAGGMAGYYTTGPTQSGGGGGGSSYIDLNHFTNPWFYGFNNAQASVTFSYTNSSNTFSISASADSICSGNSVTLTANGAQTYTWLPLGNFAGSTATQVVLSPSVNSSYTLLGGSVSGCTFQISRTIKVMPSVPSLSVYSIPGNSVCLGSTITLLALGADTYSWSGGITNGIAFSPTSNAVYTLSASNSCGSLSQTSTVWVQPLPASLQLSSPVCMGAPATLSVVSAANAFTWHPSGTIGTNSTLVITPTTNLVYSVSVSNGTCLGSASLQVIPQPTPMVLAMVPQNTLCMGASVPLIGVGANAYTLQPGGITGTTFTLTPAFTTDYTLTGINSFSCFQSAHVSLTVHSLPYISLSSSHSLICNGNSATLTASGADAYVWNTGANTPTAMVSPQISTQYTVLGFSSITGCSSMLTANVAVFSPNLNTSPSASICVGDSLILNAIGHSSASTYLWLNTGSSQASISVSPQVNTVYTVSAFTPSGNIVCENQAIVQVVVNSLPSLTITASQNTICLGEGPVTISALGASGYSWSTGQAGNQILVSPSLTTLYTLIGSSAFLCKNTASIQVNVEECLQMNEVENPGIRIMLFPNPNSGKFKLISSETVVCQVYNELGQYLREEELTPENSFSKEIQNLLPGLYYIRVNHVKNSKVFKVVVLAQE